MSATETSGAMRRFWQWLPAAGVVCLLGGFAMALVDAHFTQNSTALSIFGLLLFLTLFVRVEMAYLRYYLYLSINTVLVFGICAVIYLFGRTHNFEYDLSKNQVNTLSDETRNYIGGLEHDVAVTIFLDQADAVEKLLKRYADLSTHFKYAVYDAVKQPEKAAAFDNAVSNGDIFVESGGRRDKLNVFEIAGDSVERFFTRAIYRVTRNEKIVVYFLIGHGEISFDPPQQAANSMPLPSLARFRAYLGERAIETRPLDLAQTPAVPADANLVVIAGPRTDLFENEEKSLETYLKGAGKLMALLHVQIGDGSPIKLDKLDELLASQGVMTSTQVILDKGSGQLGQKPFYPMIDRFNAEQPITKPLIDEPRSLLPGMCYLLYTDPNRPDLKFDWLAVSTKDSWAESLALLFLKLRNKQAIEPEKNEPVAPQAMGMAVEPAAPPKVPNLPALKPKDGARLVVFGSSVFIQDAYILQSYIARELMLNCVKWLTDSKSTIDVPARMADSTPIQLDDARARVVFVFAVLIMPAFIFFGGVSYAMLRRRS